MAPPAARPGRDLRLDFFRGLALWFIFLDHLEATPLEWLTIRNYGISDATEIFIFISGYSAALAYGGLMRRRGFLLAAAGIYRRCWQIYIAHVVLFVLYTAYVAYVALRFNNPMFAEELGVTSFLHEPHIALMQALLLKFRPVNLDILPLYIVLLALFPPVLWALQRWPWPVLLASFALYLLADRLRWNLPAYPGDGVWYFNPYCWQLLFVIGAICGTHPHHLSRLEPGRRALIPTAVVYILFALYLVLSWRWQRLGDVLPGWLNNVIYPIDKTNMDILRLLHFLAIGYLTMVAISRTAPFLTWRWAQPLVWCGQHSLQIFCLGTFLAMFGRFALAELPPRPLQEIGTGLLGIGAMSAAAFVLTWYKRAQRPPAPAVAATS